MKIFYKSLCTATLAVSMCASAFATAMAAPVITPLSEVGQAQVIQVQSYNKIWPRSDRNRRTPDFERRNGKPYYKGHRGYSERRTGYRQHNGYWFPPSAFVGTIIGGVLNGSTAGSSHVAWCDNHYRSYRASDDSYQPYHGPRKRCISR